MMHCTLIVNPYFLACHRFRLPRFSGRRTIANGTAAGKGFLPAIYPLHHGPANASRNIS
jgi:hypothetical protein